MRRTYLVDKKFQHRFALEMVLFVLVVPFLVWLNVFVFGLLSFDKTEFAAAARSSGGVAMLVVSKRWITMTAVYLANIAIIYALIVYRSHRIAGPVHRFTQILKQIADGDLTQHVKLRKYDFLKELGVEINRVARVHCESIVELQNIERALKNIDRHLNHPALGKELVRLEAVLARYRTAGDTHVSSESAADTVVLTRPE